MEAVEETEKELKSAREATGIRKKKTKKRHPVWKALPKNLEHNEVHIYPDW